MPLFSAFTPFGLLDFSSQDSDAEKAYRELKANYGEEAFDYTIGTEHEADVYATAMAIGAAKATIRRAGNQHNPATAFELLPAHEAAFGLVPARGASLASRQAAAAARNRVLRGSRPEAIQEALEGVLGSDLLAIRVLTVAESDQWPTSIVDAGPGLYSDPRKPLKFIKLLDPVAGALDGITPIELTLPYENWDTTDTPVTLARGELLLVEPEIPDEAEVVEVTEVATVGGVKTFTAEFLRAHNFESAATTRPTPIRTSTKRHYLIVVTASASLDAVIRKQVNETMQRMVRGVSTWNIVQPYDIPSRVVGPFFLNQSGLGVVTIEQITY
jgi:hypothetical protein